MTIKQIAINPYLTWGTGVDSATEQPKGVAIKQGETEPSTGNVTEFSYSFSKNQKDFQEALDISAAASVNNATFGGNAKASLSEKKSSSTTDISLVIKCTIKALT